MSKKKTTVIARLTVEDMFHIESVLCAFLKATEGDQDPVIHVIRGAQAKITAILSQANSDGLIDYKSLRASKLSNHYDCFYCGVGPFTPHLKSCTQKQPVKLEKCKRKRKKADAPASMS